MRTFIALELPEEVKKEIFKIFEDFKNSGAVVGNFVNKENIHLTLKFLGDISEEKTREIEKKLSEINFQPFSANVGEIGFFPSEEHMKVIWIGLASDKVLALKKMIDDSLDMLGLSPDNKEFSSHITVARIKNIKDEKIFFERIKKLKIRKMKVDIKHFSLIKSELRRDGPIYKIIKEFKLK